MHNDLGRDNEMTSGLRSVLTAAAAAALLYLPAAASAQSNRWLPYEGHMHVHFSIDHNGMSDTRGTFRELTGELIYDDANPEASQLSVTIEAASLDTAHAYRDNFVRGPHFFDSVKYRHITFKSTKVTKTGDTTGTVTGDLTMHGVTKPVTLDVKLNKKSKRPSGEDYLGFAATAKLNRLDWGITAFSKLSPPAVTGEIVDMVISAEFVRQK
jgi:polyisoprenoid-binding protein YceI